MRKYIQHNGHYFEKDPINDNGSDSDTNENDVLNKGSFLRFFNVIFFCRGLVYAFLQTAVSRKDFNLEISTSLLRVTNRLNFTPVALNRSINDVKGLVRSLGSLFMGQPLHITCSWRNNKVVQKKIVTKK